MRDLIQILALLDVICELFIRTNGLIHSSSFLITNTAYERMQLATMLHKRSLRSIIRSKCALALPVTFLILFVSTLGIISVTYYFSIERINTQDQALKASTSKQSFQSLDDAILSTLGQPGSSVTFDLADSGGLTEIQPTGNILTIRVNDSIGIDETIFNSSLGEVTYELPYLGSLQTGLYLQGDSQTITNQSGSSLSQLYIARTSQGPEIQLSYRPAVSYMTGGSENGKSVTDIRIYIINLNSSAPISLQGELPLLISCTATQLTTKTYEVSYQPENLAITSQLGGVYGSVSIPLSPTSNGAIINVETVVSNISIERWLR